jgi:hypothetical protein
MQDGEQLESLDPEERQRDSAVVLETSNNWGILLADFE